MPGGCYETLAAFAIQAPQPRQLTDAAAGRDLLDFDELADKLEFHPGAILAAS